MDVNHFHIINVASHSLIHSLSHSNTHQYSDVYDIIKL